MPEHNLNALETSARLASGESLSPAACAAVLAVIEDVREDYAEMVAMAQCHWRLSARAAALRARYGASIERASAEKGAQR